MRWLLAAICAVLILPEAASAWTVGENLAAARQTLPAGHPCKTGPVDIIPSPGLRIQDTQADGGAPRGFLIAGQWLARTQDGNWMPLPCQMQINPDGWTQMTPCQQRRLIFHEAGHWAGNPDGTGIMDTYAAGRDEVAVPGCPVARPAMEDLVILEVLDRLPAGWDVSCGQARHHTWSCRADKGHQTRRYRVRVVNSQGMTVKRIAR